MNSSSTQGPSKQHPHLSASTLFLVRPPGIVKDSDIIDAFEKSNVGITISQSDIPRRPLEVKRINFPSIALAGKALATVRLANSSSTESNQPLLRISGGRRNVDPHPPPFVFPRYVVYNPFPHTVTCSQLYDVFRPYGPIASCHHDINGCGKGVIQFWREEDAQTVERNVEEVKINGYAIHLQRYDPRNLFCTNFDDDIDTVALRKRFEQFGHITSANVVLASNTANRRFGFVAFRTPGQAAAALKAMNNVASGSRTMVVRYHEPKPKFKRQKMAEKQPSHASDINADSHRNSTKSTTVAEDENNVTSQHNYTDVQAHAEPNQQKHEESFRSQALAWEKEREELKAEIERLKKQLELSESRRKILELEMDKPKWEEARRQREAQEKREHIEAEERRRQKDLAESRRKLQEMRAEEEERKQAAEKARQEALKRAAEEKARKEKEEEDRRREQAHKRAARYKATIREQIRCRDRDRRLWGKGPWTSMRALERFQVLSEEFVKIKFSESQPFTCEVVPWPVLDNPIMNDFDFDWSDVEAFFAYAKQAMVTVKYKLLVEETHRMFHPDKWRSRGLLNTVFDERLRTSLEKLGNIVAQAMTPLWRNCKGYE